VGGRRMKRHTLKTPKSIKTLLAAAILVLTALLLVGLPGLGCHMDSLYLEEIEEKVATDEAGALTPREIIVSRTSLTTTEDGGSDSFTIRLNERPTHSVQIDISSSNTNEGTVSPATITFTTSNYAAPQTVTVTGVDDAVADGDTIFSIIFEPIVSSDAAYASISVPPISAVNIDNDTKGITVSKTSLTTTEAGGSDSFTIRLNSQPTSSVQISMVSSNTNEGTVSPATINFTTSNYAAPQTVTVTGVDDAIDDGNVNYSIMFDPVASSDPDYAAISVNSISVLNMDNDNAGIIVSKSSIVTTEANDGAPDATFTVALNSQPKSNVIITITSSNINEGVITTGSSLTFTPSNYSAKTVGVTGVDDYFDDGNVSYEVALNVSSSDAAYNNYGITPVSATNVDNDDAGIILSPSDTGTNRLLTDEEGRTAFFTVRLKSQPKIGSTVTLTVTPSNPLQGGTVNKSSIVFNDGDANPDNDWNDPISVIITGTDNDVSGYIDYQINFYSSSTDSDYNKPSPGWTDKIYVRNLAESRTVATPNVTPESTSSDRHSVSQTISIISNDLRCSEMIYYTTNGTTPTTSSTLYTGPFTVSGNNTTITAKAFYEDWNPSGTDSEQYVIPYLRERSVNTSITVTTGIKYYSTTNEVLIPNFSTGKVNRFRGLDLSAISTYASGISNLAAITAKSDSLYIGTNSMSGADRYEYWTGSPMSRISQIDTGASVLRALDWYSSKLYIADDSPSNPKVLEFDLSTDTLTRTFGPSMGSDGSLADASGITTCNGFVYVADSGNNRIARWRLSDGWYINPVWNVDNPIDICSDDNSIIDYAFILSLGTSSAKVVIYNASNNTFIDWFPVDEKARKITINESSGDLYIFRSDGYLDKYIDN
jgi:hypothetical protein